MYTASQKKTKHPCSILRKLWEMRTNFNPVVKMFSWRQNRGNRFKPGDRLNSSF